MSDGSGEAGSGAGNGGSADADRRVCVYVLPAPEADRPPVGRDREISRLRNVVKSLAAGKGAVVEITGEPGIGKTALLSVLAAQAAAIGAEVLRAHALRGANVSYQVFRDAWGDRPGLRSASEDLQGRSTASMPADSSHLHRFRQGRTMRTMFADWAAFGGGMLALDDVHLCDRESADLIAQLIRTPVPGPFILAVAHRPRQTPPVLLDALTQGARAGTVVRLEPAALDVETVTALLRRWRLDAPADPGRSVPDLEAYAQRLHAASGGNPSYLRILVGANWQPGGWPDYLEADRDRLLREAVAPAAELDALGPHATTVAGAAAALGDPFHSEDVALVAELELGDAVDALAELARADIVSPLASGGRFAFRHPVLRHVAHERAEASLRLSAHRHALELLVSRGASAAAQARHAEYALGVDGPAAAEVLAAGATEVMAQAPATAARWLRLALESLPGGDRSIQRRATLMLACCHALTAAGRPQEARDLAHEVLRDQARLTPDLRVKAHAACAGYEMQLGRYDEAEAVARAAIDTLPRPLPDPLPAGVAELAFKYGVVHLLRGTYGQARALLQAVVERPLSPEQSKETGAYGRSVFTLETSTRVLAACGDSYLGNTASAGAAITEHAQLIDGLPDAAVARHPELLSMLGCAELLLERFPAASRHLSRVLTLAKGSGPQQTVPYALVGLALAEQRAGRLEQAEQWAIKAEQAARTTGMHDVLSLAITRRAGVLVWARSRSDYPALAALIEHGIRNATPHGWWSGFAIGQLAEIRLMSGDPQGCIQTLLDGGGGEGLPLLQPSLKAVLLSMLSSAALRAGDLDAARRWAGDAQDVAERLGLPLQRAAVQRVYALLHSVDGDHEEAAELFEQAADGFRRAGAPVDHAWTLVMGARSVATVQGPAPAVSWLDTAMALARNCGAARVLEGAEHARGKLAAQATAARPAAASGRNLLALLTERERQIASLAGAGRRTREIADQLYLSPRTVDTHLARIYRKLNVSSRAALTNILLRAGNSGTDRV